MAQTLLLGLNLLLVLATIASVAGWGWILRRRVTRRKPLLAPRAQREPFWSLAEFFVCFGLFLVCSTAAVVTAQRFQAEPSPAAVTDAAEGLPTTSEGLAVIQVAGSIASLLVLASVLLWMGLTRRDLFVRYGLWPSLGDLRLGLIASLFILPPVLQLASLLDYFVSYEHPVLEVVKENPTLSVFLAMTFSAAIMAPLFEEFMFRALLQGGAQKLSRRLTLARQAVAAGEDRPETSDAISCGEVVSWTWGPVMISSVTFAIMHLGQGAAPIPLFVFAVALGYLYRQTGRLWPCITVHFLLNAFSMIGLGLEVAANGS